MAKEQKTIKISRDEIFDILESDSCKLIKEEGGKHDCTWNYYVFEKDNKYYMMYLAFSYRDGLQIDEEIEVGEVKPVEVITIDYEPVYES